MLVPIKAFPRIISSAGSLATLVLLYCLVTCNAWATFSQAAIQPDGKIILAGAFSGVDGHISRNLIRLNPNGSVDTTFTSAVQGEPTAVALGPDNQIITFVVLPKESAFHSQYGRLFFLATNGSVVASSSVETIIPPGVATYLVGPHLYPTPDGKLMLSPYFYISEDHTYSNLARFNVDGSLDRSFTYDKGIEQFATVEDKVRFRLDGSMLLHTDRAAGVVSSSGSTLLRIPGEWIGDVAFLTNGSFLVSDSLEGPTTRTNIVHKFDQNGRRDQNYEVRFRANINLFPLRNGQIIVWNSEEQKLLDQEGNFLKDLHFPEMVAVDQFLAEQADGKLLVSASVMGPQFRNVELRLARLNPDLTLDKTFNHYSDKELHGVWLEFRKTEHQIQLEVHWRKFRTAAIYESTDLQKWTIHSIVGLKNPSPIVFPIEPLGGQRFFRVIGE